MSKTLHEKVEQEISRREQERLRKEKEEEKAKKDKSKEVILRIFSEFLDECLQKLEDYRGHKVLDYKTNDIYQFRNVVQELGFKYTYSHKVSFNSYNLSVPAFEKGNKRTPAQLMLFKFEQKLAKARKEKKSELLIECKRVRQLIDEGSYEYRVGNGLHPTRIWVVSEQKTDTEFEVGVVQSFFSKFKFRFDGCECNKWNFAL